MRCAAVTHSSTDATSEIRTRRRPGLPAAVSRASAVVVSFADTPKALAILAHVRELRPELPVIVRTFDDSDVARLRAAGAAEIVAEVVEGSLMLATQTMLQLGVPLNRVLRGLREIRPNVRTLSYNLNCKFGVSAG